MNYTEKIKNLNKVLAGINKEAGRTIVGFLDDEVIKDKLSLKFIPSPNDDLNAAIGGGFPKGRCTIVSGTSDSLKTGILLETAGKYLKANQDALVLWLESENSITSLEYLVDQFGIDPKRFVYVSLEYKEGGEAAIERCINILKAVDIDMFCINSMRALVPKTELDKKVSEDTVAVQARMNTKALKQICSLAAEKETAVCIVQHLSTMIGTMSRDPLSLGGGLYMKYLAHLILDFRKQTLGPGDPVAKEEGAKAVITVKKNHITPMKNPYVKVNHYVIYGEGTEVYLTTLDKAVEENIIRKSGAWYYWDDKELKWNGKAAYRAAMKQDEDLFLTLRNTVKNKIENLTAEEAKECEEEEKTIQEIVLSHLKEEE